MVHYLLENPKPHPTLMAPYLLEGRDDWLGGRKAWVIIKCASFLSLQGKMMTTMNVGRRSCPPVLIMWCTFWLCSGRSCLPSSLLRNTGTAGRASLSPFSWLAYWQLSLEIWLPTLVAPLAWKIPSPQSCLSHLELQCQVQHAFYLIPLELEAHLPSWSFLSYNLKGCDNEPGLWRRRDQRYK